MHAFIIKSLSLHEKCKFSDLLFMAETIKTIKLSQIKVNAENPRTITGDKFQKLVNSILVFPKMLGVRPIVINKQYKALGGNMRTNALNYISKLTIQQIEERLACASMCQMHTSRNCVATALVAVSLRTGITPEGSGAKHCR